MLEPIVQDYLEAATKLDEEAFCAQLDAPVLITALPEATQSFQSDPTRMLAKDESLAPAGELANLDHRAKVLELRPLKADPQRVVTIGRSEDNDLVLQDETVSSQHAIFTFEPKTGQPVIQDQESTNGSRINEALVVPGRFVRLNDGDVVSLGDAVFVFYTPAGLYNMLLSMVQAG